MVHGLFDTTHNLKVVAPEDHVAPAVHFLSVHFFQLRRKILGRFERPLPAPVNQSGFTGEHKAWKVMTKGNSGVLGHGYETALCAG